MSFCNKLLNYVISIYKRNNFHVVRTSLLLSEDVTKATRDVLHALTQE